MRSTAVEELLGRAVRAGLTPGAVAAWGHGGDPPRLAAVGRSRLMPSCDPATPETWYDLASLTKPLVTGTLSLLAARDGTMTLATRVGEILPEAEGRPIAAVTVHQLLSHSAGLPAWRPLYAHASGSDDAVAAILDLDLERQPGTTVEYSCPGYLLLGKMLERVLGVPLDVAFARRVLAPLGLGGHAGFRPDRSAGRGVAGGAAVAAVERRLCAELELPTASIPAPAAGLPDDGNARFLGGVAGNAGLFATASAVYQLAAQYLGPSSRVLTAAEIALATSRAAGGDSEGEQVRGLGWQLAVSPGCSAGPALGPAAFGHTGFTGTSVWVEPERALVLVLLANRHHPGHHEVDLHPLRRAFHGVASRELGTG